VLDVELGDAEPVQRLFRLAGHEVLPVLLLPGRRRILWRRVLSICGKEPATVAAGGASRNKDAGGVEERRSLRATQLAWDQRHVGAIYLLEGYSSEADSVQRRVVQLRGGGRWQLCLRHRPVRGLHCRLVHKDMAGQPQQAGRDQHHQGHRSIHTCSHTGADCLSDRCTDPGAHTGADCLSDHCADPGAHTGADCLTDHCADPGAHTGADCLTDPNTHGRTYPNTNNDADTNTHGCTHHEPDSLANYGRGLP